MSPNLYQARVIRIIKDSYGLIWTITNQGVYRIEGDVYKKFRVYEDEEEDNLSLPKFLGLDNNKNIIVSDFTTLNFFDKTEKKFKKICNLHNTKFIFQSKDNKIFIYKNDGLFLLEDTKSLKKVFSNKLNLNGEEIKIRSIFNINKNNYLINTANEIIVYDFKKNIAKHRYKKRYGFIGGQVTSNNKLCITSYKGVFIYDLETDSHDVIKLNRKGTNTNTELILDICEVNNELWIAHDNNSGVYSYSWETKKLNKINIYTEDEVFRRMSVRCIYFNKGVVMLGTVFNGLFYKNFNLVYTKHIKSDNGNSLSLNRIPSLMADQNNYLYVGTDGMGLDILSPDRQKIENIRKHISFISMLDYDEDNILLGSYRYGIFKFDKKTKKLTQKTKGANVWQMLRKSEDEIFVSAGRLKVYDNNFKPIHTYKISPVTITDMVKHNNVFYFSSFHKIFKLKPGAKKLEEIRIPNTQIYDIEKKDKNSLWLGTNVGLYTYNIYTGIIKKHYKSPSNLNIKLMVKKDSRLWMGTEKGVVSFDTKNKRMRTHGFGTDINFKRTSVCIDRKGVIYMGGNNGLLAFHPDSLKNKFDKAKIVFTDFIINTEHPTHKLLNKKNINEIKRLSLNHNQSSFTIKFCQTNTGFNYQKNFYYKLEPVIKKWTELTGHKLDFYSLPKGKYTLKLKIGNDNSSEITKLTISIQPPWWNTIWAKIGFILITGFLIFLFVKYYLRKRKKLIEDEKREKEKELYKDKVRYFTNISHEIRTPLSLIKSPIEKIKKDINKVTQYEVDLINDNVNRLNRMVETVLNIQKIDFDIDDLKFSESNIVCLSKNTIQKFKRLAEAKSIELNISYSSNSMLIWIDYDKMEMVLDNLILNAIKYSKEKSKVELKLEETADIVKIIVADTGIGIKEEQLPNIFDRFYQANKKIGGAGVGLSIVKSFVEKHDASIEVKSKFGVGTHFEINLKKGDSHIDSEKKIEEKNFKIIEQEENNTIDTTDIPEVKNKKILIIEDDIELGNYLVKCFEKNYIVTLKKDGLEGLNFIKENEVDIVISDVMMPVMNGKEVCKKIKENIDICHIPIILLTAKSEKQDIVDGYKIGADAYVTKPFDLDLLYSRVANLIINRSKLKDRFLKELKVSAEEITHSQADEDFLKKSIAIIEQNISNSEFDVNAFVSEIGYGRTVAYKKIKAITGQSIKDFILTIRLKKAATLLIHTQMPIIEISEAIGVSNPQYFSTMFKKFFKITPSKYRHTKSDIETMEK
jgi:signal transduction histidine kinase/DNA-binding response OmpR family regulator/ligand-binding sensor domain-containing protein